jgi:Ser/Thr protein kinase RdoA (MazF antagonist)
MTMPVVPLTETERTVVETVLAQYAQDWQGYAPLPKWYETHLRVLVTARDGRQYQLRERPKHLALADWSFHHALQPEAPPLPTVPGLLRTREGAAYVAVGTRHCELITWLPGTSCGVTEPWQYAALGTAVAELHDWLWQQPLPAAATRRVATTNDMGWWLRELRRDGKPYPSMVRFCALADELLATLPDDPPVAVHGDVHPYNLLWQDHQVCGFCDWEDAHLASPSFDLMYLLTHTTFITWPHRLPAGREAFVREAVDEAASLALLRAYRQRLGRPIPVAGLARALVLAWVTTMRTTILRQFVNETCSAEGLRLLEWLAEPAHLAPWRAILGDAAAPRSPA